MSVEVPKLEELVSILPPGRAKDKYIKKLEELKNNTQRDVTHQDIPALQEEFLKEEARHKEVPKEQGPEEQKISPDQESFDPDGALASLLECAKRKGIPDAQVASILDDLIMAKSLKAPWGIRIKNSAILVEYWIVSDEEAKKLIHGNEITFTQEEIGLLAEVREIFGIQAVQVKKR